MNNIHHVLLANKIKNIMLVTLCINSFSLMSCLKKEFSYEDDEIFYKWSVTDQNFSIHRKESKISIKLEYLIKNKSEKDLWLYDQENGSLWQAIKTSISYDTIESKYIMYQKWVYPLPYDYSHPKSIYIRPNHILSGTMKIEYYPYNQNDYFDLSKITMQKFNFFILEHDISTNQDDEVTVNNIAENYSKSYTVELPIRLITQKYKGSFIKNEMEERNIGIYMESGSAGQGSQKRQTINLRRKGKHNEPK